jgi:hypothetical protein
MFRGSAAKVAAATLASVVVAGTGLFLGGTAANAATAQTAKYTCKIPVVGSTPVTAKLTLSTPSKVSPGGTAKIGVLFVPSGLPAVTITNVTIKWTLTESGAAKGSVSLSDHFASGNSGSLKVDLAGALKLPKSGTVKLTAGPTFTISLTNSVIGTATLSCTASSTLPVLGSITVGKAGKAVRDAISGRNVSDER